MLVHAKAIVLLANSASLVTDVYQDERGYYITRGMFRTPVRPSNYAAYDFAEFKHYGY